MTNIVSTMLSKCLSKIILKIKMNGVTMNALIDTGSLQSFVNSGIAKVNQWKITHCYNKITYGKYFIIFTSGGSNCC